MYLQRHPLSIPLTLAILLLAHATAVSVNRTIDDAYGDEAAGVVLIYDPPDPWNKGNDCTRKCVVSLDSHNVFGGTWHGMETEPGIDDRPRSIRVTFMGTALYIYNILANNLGPGVTATTSLTFRLDNDPVESFTHIPGSETDLEYNMLVYSKESLANVEHTMTIVIDPNTPSLTLFDYIVYTTEVEDIQSLASSTILRPSSQALQPSARISGATPTASSDISPKAGSTHTGAIIGVTVSAVLSVAVITSLVVYYLRRMRGGRCIKSQGNRLSSILPSGDSDRGHILRQPSIHSRHPVSSMGTLSISRPPPGPPSSVFPQRGSVQTQSRSLQVSSNTIRPQRGSLMTTEPTNTSSIGRTAALHAKLMASFRGEASRGVIVGQQQEIATRSGPPPSYGKDHS